jgi:hypothetical protein
MPDLLNSHPKDTRPTDRAGQTTSHRHPRARVGIPKPLDTSTAKG